MASPRPLVLTMVLRTESRHRQGPSPWRCHPDLFGSTTRDPLNTCGGSPVDERQTGHLRSSSLAAG